MASHSADAPAAARFSDLGLPAPLLQALTDVGYESPSPIQAATIPPLLAGRDVLGQAQTGTGKTAAFALPALAALDLSLRTPQVLVLAPTRELAIQVAEAFQRYAAHLPGFHVLPIYGGQGYGPQLQGLRRGAHVIVGTPGRVVDHLRKGTLDLSSLRVLVLDEADEMLRMGFTEDVDKVLEATPPTRRVALFSATMPAPIRRIAQTHLKDPAEITIRAETTTATHIRQRYWWVSGIHKLDALTRILEAEPFDAMIIFARTKQATEELSTRLQARGFAAAAINGDLAQPQRERVIGQLRDGQLDILVATDVAARGLDVERISHVLNYDIPYDTESYVHRIGRTGRAGRSGDAILFVTPRERGMLRAIERATRQPIEQMHLPTVEAVNDRRIERFMERIGEALQAEGLDAFRELIERYETAHDVPAIEIAAALARLAHGDKPLLLDVRDEPAVPPARSERAQRPERGPGDDQRPERPQRPQRPHVTEPGKTTWRLEVGHMHGIKPGNIIGAIANEADMESRYIGRLSIRDDHSLIDLPEGMPKELQQHLSKVRVGGQMLRLSRWDGSEAPTSAAGAGRAAFKPRKGPGKGPARGGPRKPGGFKGKPGGHRGKP